MIKSLALKDFQKHKNLSIDFVDGINVIIGESRAGKSSCFRALKFALYNDCRKTNIVNNDAKVAETEIDINDIKIKRIKGKSRNEYYVDDMLLKAFGTGVPNEVQEVTRLGDINIQGQHDVPFLVSDSISPGQVAKYLNQLVGIDDIDHTLFNLNSAHNEANKKAKYEREKLDDIKENIRSMDYLKDCVEDFDILQKAEIDAFEARQQAESLSEHIISIEKIEAAESFDVSEMTILFDELINISDAYEDDLLDFYKLDRVIKSFPKEIEMDFDAFDLIMEDNHKIESIELSIFDLDKIIVGVQSIDLEADEKEINLALDELKEVSPECPTCGGDW